MPQLFLAYEARIDFINKTDPFRSSQPKFTKEQQAKIAEQRSKFALKMVDAKAKAQNG